jgi:hypothetical protein
MKLSSDKRPQPTAILRGVIVPVPSTGWESDVQIQSTGVNLESPTRRRMVKCVLDLQHVPIM